jgi:hypothetical protein
MFKVHDTRVTINLRPLKNLDVCPTKWLKVWYSRIPRKSTSKEFWYLKNKNRSATYEEMSKAVHQIMREAGIQNNPAVTSIRKSSMTKSIS